MSITHDELFGPVMWSGPTFSSAWLELAIAGLAATFVANRRVSSIQSHALCPGALIAGSRTAILRATCAASDSSWARVVRAALREPPADGESAGYRDAPQRGASAAIARLVGDERTRIVRDGALGATGVIAAFSGSAVLLSSNSAVPWFIMLLTLLVASRVLVNARRSVRALGEANHALPVLVASFPPPTTTPPLAPLPAPLPLRTPGGVLTRLFIAGFELILLVLVLALLFGMTQRMEASQIGAIFGLHVMMLPFMIVLCVMLPRTDAAIDVARAEVVFVHRILGVTYARTIAPLEIIQGFVREPRSRAEDYLAADLRGAQRLLLVPGDRVEEVATALNRALDLER